MQPGDKVLEQKLIWLKMLCMKEHVIVKDVNAQAIGPYFGISYDEVTDSSNAMLPAPSMV